MTLVLTHALRLRRRDLDRLHPCGFEQLVAAIAPGEPDAARELVSDGGRGDEEEETFGLVYLRFAGPRAYEGWFLDLAKGAKSTTSLEGGAFFVAGTTEPAGVEMSQSSLHPPAHEEARALHAAFAALTPRFAVKTSGPALKSDPPFAHEKAPPAPAAAIEPGTLALELVSAERYTQADVRAATREKKWLLLHSVRPRFATNIDDMESFFALGILYGMIDPGAGDAVTAMPLGLAHVRVRTKEPVPRTYEGFFFDSRQKQADAYWPSTRVKLADGRLFVDGTVTFSGVELRKGKLVVDAKKGRPEAAALAAGLQALGLAHEVVLVSPAAPGATGFFGSPKHRELTGAGRPG